MIPDIGSAREVGSPLGRGPKRARWRQALYIALAVAFVYAGVSVAGGVSDAFDKMRHVSLWWFVPAIAAVGLRFVFLGAQLRYLRGAAHVPGIRLGITVALVAFGLGGLMPASPAEGFTLSSVALRQRGMTQRQAWLMLVSSQWAQFWALITVFALDRVAVAATGEIHRRHPWRIVMVSIALLAISAGASWVIRRPGSARRISTLGRWIPGQQRHQSELQRAEAATTLHAEIRLALGNRRNRLRVSVLSALCWVADALALWCMLAAVGARVSIEVAVIAYVVATVVAWAPFVPSGIGLAELAVPALLYRFHVPTVTGLAAVLLWRGVSLVLPAIAGAVAWLSLRAPTRPRTRSDEHASV